LSDFSLYGRMLEHGTLAETSSDIPDARFALPSTIHWIRALAILAEASDVGFATARRFYASVQRRTMADREIDSVCEQMFFAFHQLAALAALELAPNKADVARIGIVAWYYGIYGAASAMIAAVDGSFPDTHAATAQQWDRQFAANGLVIAPFADRLSYLTDAELKTHGAASRNISRALPIGSSGISRNASGRAVCSGTSKPTVFGRRLHGPFATPLMPSGASPFSIRRRAIAARRITATPSISATANLYPGCWMASSLISRL
jgi:hypothetical protein